MQEYIEILQNNRELLSIGITVLLAIIEIVRERMKSKDALMLLLNSLKDENKMQGNKFSDALIDKLYQVAEVQKVGKDALEEVKQTIEKPRDGLRIGSYRGKPIYVQDVGVVARWVSALYSSVKGVFKR